MVDRKALQARPLSADNNNGEDTNPNGPEAWNFLQIPVLLLQANESLSVL